MRSLSLSLQMTLSADIYELVMMICMKAEEYDKVLELYREMHDAGVEPKVYSYIMLLAIHGRRGDYQAAWDLFHSVRSRRSIPRSDNLYNAAIWYVGTEPRLWVLTKPAMRTTTC